MLAAASGGSPMMRMQQQSTTQNPHTDRRNKRKSQILSWFLPRSQQCGAREEDQDNRQGTHTAEALAAALAKINGTCQAVAAQQKEHKDADAAFARSSFFKRKSALLTNGAASELAEEQPTVRLVVDPGRDGHVYHPGGLVLGGVGFMNCGEGACDVKSVHIRIIGEMRVSQFELNDSGTRKIVRAHKHRFLTLPMLRVRHSADCVWTEEVNPDTGKPMTMVPFELRLPEKGFSITDPVRLSKMRAPLPPTMHWEENDEEHGDTREDIKARHRGSVVSGVFDKLKKITHTDKPHITSQIRYCVTVEVRWKGSHAFPRDTNLSTDIVVLPRPPTSASINHLTNERRLPDTPLGRALSATQAIDPQQIFPGMAEREGQRSASQPDERIAAASSATDQVETAAQQRARQRASVFGYARDQPQRQERALPDPPQQRTSDSQWTKIVLVESSRGPQAWQLHHMAVADASEEVALETELSMPATVALLLDRSSPFHLTVNGKMPNHEIDSITFKLVRSITSSTTLGKVELERQQEPLIDGRPVLELQNLEEVAVAQPPPLDEYNAGEQILPPVVAYQGKMVIASGWRQSRHEIAEGAKQTMLMKKDFKDAATSVQRGSLLTTPSFTFRGVTLEYGIALSLRLKPKHPTAFEIELQTEPTTVKVASSAGNRAAPPQTRRASQRTPTARPVRSTIRLRSTSNLRAGPSRPRLRSRSRSRVQLRAQTPVERPPPFEPTPTTVREEPTVREESTVMEESLRATGGDDDSWIDEEDERVEPQGHASVNSSNRSGETTPFSTPRPIQRPWQPLPDEDLDADDEANGGGSSDRTSIDGVTNGEAASPPSREQHRRAENRSASTLAPPPRRDLSDPHSAPDYLEPNASSSPSSSFVPFPDDGLNLSAYPSVASIRTIDGPAPPYCRPNREEQ